MSLFFKHKKDDELELRLLSQKFDALSNELNHLSPTQEPLIFSFEIANDFLMLVY
jgi:hypothetical protein